MPEAQGDGRGAHLSIGEVLALLLEEFPDVTISKIRFLESKGLIDPERTPSGYRKFYDEDVELLRCILHEQRENFLPLKVIKNRLDTGEIDPTDELTRPRGIRNVRLDDDVTGSLERPEVASRSEAPAANDDSSGGIERRRQADRRGATADTATAQPAEAVNATTPQARTAASQGATAGATPTAATATPAANAPLHRDDVAAAAGITPQQVDDLTSYGVLRGQGKREITYDRSAVEIAALAKHLLDAGVEPRHLRGWRVAVDREVSLFEQLVQPLVRQRNPESLQAAAERLGQLEAAGGALRTAMMRAALRQHRNV